MYTHRINFSCINNTAEVAAVCYELYVPDVSVSEGLTINQSCPGSMYTLATCHGCSGH